MKQHFWLAVAGAVLAATGVGRSAELLLEYTFNDSGPVTRGTERSAWDWPLEFQTQAGDPADWHGAAGSGVSGQPADRAFDNTASDQMGSGGSGGRAWGNPGVPPAQDSVTFSGWFRTQDVPVGAFGRLFFWDGRSELYAYPETGLYLSVGNNRSIGSDLVYPEVGEWVFFAASFDGTQATDNVRFWKGTRTSPVIAAGVRTLPEGAFEAPYATFAIGNSFSYSSPTQPFDGWLDNLRFHGGTGSSGVLDQAELEALRKADVAGEAPVIRIRVNLAVELVPGPPAELQFSWWSVGGYDYQLQRSTGLSSWEDVPSVQVTGDGTRQSRSLASLPAAPTFYRLKVTPP